MNKDQYSAQSFNVIGNCGVFFFFLINLFIYLFIYFWLCSVSLLHAGFLQLWRTRATLRHGVQASHCGGFSCCRAQALLARASVVVARRLSSCGSWAQLLRSMWDLPRPGLEPMSPALAGRFLTTVPPGKRNCWVFQSIYRFSRLGRHLEWPTIQYFKEA